jgi:SAM-dependent methyltransferase
MDRPDRRQQPEAEPRLGPRVGDAFGMILMACWEHGGEPGQVKELIERDDGYLDAMDAARYFDGPATWGHLGNWACDQARGRVLDVGSGAGRHALHLQERGHPVVALDISPLAAEVCRRRGVREVVTGTIADLVARGGGPFDSFLMLGGNLGLLESAEKAGLVLETLARLATPDATIVGQGLDPYRTDNALHLGYHQRNRALGRMGGQIRMRVRHQDVATEWFDYLFTSIDELNGLLERSPWRLDRYEMDGAAYIAVLRRVP